MGMIRLNHYLPRQQVLALRDISRRTGLSLADLIRRAVEMYLEKQKAKKD